MEKEGDEQFALKNKIIGTEKSEMQIVSKERKEEILEKLEKAASPDYVTTWDEKGVPTSKSKVEIEKGKKAKKSGGDFELKVRKDLEEKGWTVSKWQNNVDLEQNKIIPAKRIFNPFRKVMTIGTGFPDFIAFQRINETSFNVIGVESKVNNTLAREEKIKCAFLLKHKVFNDIWISSKGVKRGEIVYESFKEHYPKFLEDAL